MKAFMAVSKNMVRTSAVVLVFLPSPLFLQLPAFCFE